jgi:hypothetical protein
MSLMSLTQRTGVAVVVAVLFGGALGCDRLGVPPPRVAFPWQGIADVAEPAPMVPLAVPSTPLRAERGHAGVAYPASFAVSVQPDGSVAFPKDTPGHVSGANVVAGSTVLASLNDAGEVSGSGLKRKYAFNEKGDLVDDMGHGVRVTPEGHVRALGGSVRYQDVIVWRPEVRGERWDYAGWRTLSILSLLLLENALPETVGLTELTSHTVSSSKDAAHKRAKSGEPKTR